MKQFHNKFIQFLTKKSKFSQRDAKTYRHQVKRHANHLGMASRATVNQLSEFDIFFDKKTARQHLAAVSNKTAYRVWEDILSAPNLQAAAKIYSFWVDVAIYAGKRGNLDVESTIYNALIDIQVDRIFNAKKDSYQLLPQRTRETMTELAQRHDPNGNYRQLRRHLKQHPGDFGPLSLLAKDIEHLKDLSTDHEKNTVNTLIRYQNQARSLAVERVGHKIDIRWLSISGSHEKEYFRKRSRILKPVKHKSTNGYTKVSIPRFSVEPQFKQESGLFHRHARRKHAVDLGSGLFH
ncbi:RasGEF domain-containing protein [Piscirickettsia litoralis]|uniref:Ras-GEF domain-containing protein n=1 Tax=Piscirickettsia litoralis TaxID=1891921 RepID=A0ABX3A0J3_9GAMM|nr:RasGEF domain-containing protein [Piscirickettsia litoralis]ODN41985.1 hypothetical protein BGC07_02195 [Piscirickettsia litoralis]